MRSHILALTTFVIGLACTGTGYAADKVAAAPLHEDAARTRLLIMTADAKTQLVQDASDRAADVALAATAQSQLETSAARAEAAQQTSVRLNASAIELRREAYAISNQPGLSAAQNHKSVAAMEAADAAENDARVAQFSVAVTAAAASHDRVAVESLTNQIAALDARMGACRNLLKLNGAALQDAYRAPLAQR
jgi:methionyl-tRNA formyltransferase